MERKFTSCIEKKGKKYVDIITWSL